VLVGEILCSTRFGGLCRFVVLLAASAIQRPLVCVSLFYAAVVVVVRVVLSVLCKE
jgi:hypothetical protein